MGLRRVGQTTKFLLPGSTSPNNGVANLMQQSLGVYNKYVYFDFMNLLLI
jgi:hypothetical protein